jgi:hypothetical protein
MNKQKAVLGAFIALAIAGASASAAHAFGIDASAKADARVQGDANLGLKGALNGFFSRHQGDDRKGGDDQKREDRMDRQERKLEDRVGLTFGLGTVTSVDGRIITATSKKDPSITWTIDTDSNTTFAYRGDRTIDVGDRIAVAGNVTDNEGPARTIDASFVLVVDADYAQVKGTVTAVDDAADTVTVSTKHQGDVTVAVNGSTTISDRDGDAGTFSSLVVGTKVRIQGLWNSLHNLVTAATVRVKADF